LVLKIRTEGDPVLRERAKPVQAIDERILNLASDMLETMYKAPGVGLAAPQVGVGLRLVVADAGDGPHTLINPEIVEARGEEAGSEGCLSVPGVVGVVNRSTEVRVTALDRQGRRFSLAASGLLARVLQHEIDHLDGILFIDRAIEIRPADEEGD
jgi:peptide deformylase